MCAFRGGGVADLASEQDERCAEDAGAAEQPETIHKT